MMEKRPDSPLLPVNRQERETVLQELKTLRDTARGYMKSQVLLVAVHVDLFSHLGDDRLSAGEMAVRLGMDPRATRMFLDALAGMKYLEKRSGLYANTDMARRYLVRGAPLYQGESMRHRYRQWVNWSNLEDVLRSGKAPAGPGSRDADTEEQRTRDITLSMADNGRIDAELLAEILDVKDAKRLLDLGGGPGVYACALARRHPDVAAVVYDLPEVCAVARELIAEAGLADRVTTREGDLFRDDLGGRYDLILVSNIVHSYSLDQVGRMLSRCHEALHSGGRIVVKDFLLDEDRSGPLFSLIFALHMLLRSDGGDAYTFPQIEDLLARAGFVSIERVQVTEQSWLLIAEKKRGDA